MVSKAAEEKRSGPGVGPAEEGASRDAPASWPFPGEAPLEALLPEPDESTVTLALSDLIQDANGEIVLFNDSHLRRLALVTDAEELARGRAPHHVTAAGEDVTGFAYVTFDNGVTLYYQPDLELVVRHEPG